MRCPQGHKKDNEVCRRHEKEERMFLPKAPVKNYTFKCLTYLLSKVTGTVYRSQAFSAIFEYHAGKIDFFLNSTAFSVKYESRSMTTSVRKLKEVSFWFKIVLIIVFNQDRIYSVVKVNCYLEYLFFFFTLSLKCITPLVSE